MLYEVITLGAFEQRIKVIVKGHAAGKFFYFDRIKIVRINQADPFGMGNRLHLVIGNFADSDQSNFHRFSPALRQLKKKKSSLIRSGQLTVNVIQLIYKGSRKLSRNAVRRKPPSLKVIDTIEQTQLSTTDNFGVP